MPIYDFECPHGHRFEHFCSMADRLKETPCEGKVNQLVNDDELEALEGRDELPEGYAWVPIDPDASLRTRIRPVSARRSASFSMRRVLTQTGA